MANGAYINVQMSVSDYEYIKKLTNIRKITQDQLGKTTKAYQDFSTKSGAALQKSNKNFNTFAGQFGYQAQDLVVQLQQGTNAFVAFGQQGSQLLSVINPLYGLFVVMGTTIGSLVYSLANATTETKELGASVSEMTSHWEDLNEIQQQLVRNDFAKEQSKIGGQIQEVQNEIFILTGNLKNLQATAADDSYLANLFFAGAGEEAAETARRIAELEKTIIRLNFQLEQNERNFNEATGAVKDNSKEIERARQRYVDMVTDLNNQRIALGLSGEALARHNAVSRLGAEATDAQRKAYGDLAVEIYRLEEASKAAEEAEKARIKAAEDAEKKAKEDAEKAAAEKAKAQEDFYKRIEKYDVKAAEDAQTRISIQAAQELAFAQEQYNQQLISEDQFQQEKQAIIDKYNKQNEVLEKQSAEATGRAWTSALGSISDSFAVLAEDNEAFSKIAFVTSQAAAFAQAIVNANLAYTNALANVPAPYNTVVANTALVAGYSAAGTIAGQTIAGVFHGGTESVPSENSYLLQAGERVLQPSANRDLTKFLKDETAGRNNKPTQQVFNMNLDMGKAIVDDKVFAQKLMEMRNVVSGAVKKSDKENPSKRRK